MAALLALQSSLHCLAVFCSAIADGDKACSPSNAAHTAKVGFITHLSGKTPPNAYSLAATAPASRKLPRWQPQCGPQTLTGSLTIVRSLFRRSQEQRVNDVIGKRRRQGGAAVGSIAGRFAPAPSMGGERRGVCLHRRLGADRGFGRLGLLLVPF